MVSYFKFGYWNKKYSCDFLRNNYGIGFSQICRNICKILLVILHFDFFELPTFAITLSFSAMSGDLFNFCFVLLSTRVPLSFLVVDQLIYEAYFIIFGLIEFLSFLLLLRRGVCKYFCFFCFSFSVCLLRLP